MKFSCIIPYHNEGENVELVVQEIAKSSLIQEIICVDDGSHTKPPFNDRLASSRMTYVRIPTNKGKTEAVREGLLKIKGKAVLLLDSDIRNLDYREIERGLQFFQKNKPDMVVFRIYTTHTSFEGFINKYLTFSGIRVLWIQDLRTILDTNIKGYQLESAMNSYFKESKKVFWLNTNAINPNKIQKYGYLRGFVKNVMMELSILSHLGMRNHVHQLFFTRWKKIEA